MSLSISPRLDHSQIPMIDLSLLAKSESEDETLNEFIYACSEIGFLYIKNHGIDSTLIDALHHQAKLFFNQPPEIKSQIILDQKIRGYLPLFYKSYEGEDREGISHQEGFWIGHETPANHDRPLDGPNQWPNHPSGLKSTVLKYLEALEAVSHVLQRGFAAALGLEPHSFHPFFQQPTSRLKLNHYPPQENPETDNDIGVVPHTDSGGFTILWQDQNGGLEIQDKQGNWVQAPAVEDTFVVNIGNIMQIWSNGRFASTPHRVINRSGSERYSIPLFVNPDHAAMIKPLIGDQKKDFKPFVYGEHQLDLWRRTFPIAGIPHL
ncbi:MAG: isopenicillin N synthase family dioxygenase [bacterium]